MTNNPLSKYFRVHRLNTTVPSKFKLYDKDTVDVGEDLEVAVLPMTASDEMIFKNPDNLLNGTAIIEIIKSCIPQIKKPELLFANDLDALIVAIRVATYGDTMKISSECPSCSKQNDYNIDMSEVLNDMVYLDDEYSVETKEGIKIFISPIRFADTMKLMKLQFDQSKISRTMASDTLSEEEKLTALSKTFDKMSTINAEVIINSIYKVVIQSEDITVTDKGHISEFMKNLDAVTASSIDKKLNKINNLGITKTAHVECDKCKHEWDCELDYNPMDFFTKS